MPRPSSRNRTRCELWKRRPGGVWRSISSGEYDNLTIMAKRVAGRATHPIELVVLTVGVHPNFHTPPMVSYTPGIDERPVYHRLDEVPVE